MKEYKNSFELITDCSSEVKLYEKKSRAMSSISKLIKSNGITQKEASKIIGCTQNRVSDCVNGKISLFSYGWLFIALDKLKGSSEDKYESI